MTKILFVCTGNICRSPTAEGVLRFITKQHNLSDSLYFDSAGTHNYHVGEAPDSRSIAAARKRSIDISDLRARQVKETDYLDFDIILALDNSHLRQLHTAAPDNATAKLELFLPFSGLTEETEIPDPYYGDRKGFEHVLDLIESAAVPLITKLTR